MRKIKLSNLLRATAFLIFLIPAIAKAQWGGGTDIADNVYHTGKVSIGTSVIDRKLDLLYGNDEGGIRVTRDFSGNTTNGTPKPMFEIRDKITYPFNVGNYYRTGLIYDGYHFGINLYNPIAPLEVAGGGGNGAVAIFRSEESHLNGPTSLCPNGMYCPKNSLQLIPIVKTTSYNGNTMISNPVAIDNDLAMIWSDDLINNNENGRTGLVIAPKSTNSTNTGIRILANGNVGIGTALINNPNGYKLAVNGTIGAKEVRIENSTNTWTWPDYVFESNYKLRSLSEVENYINVYKHLPEMPSASEVNANGIGLAETQALLLKKIEELTLYMIDLQKHNELLEKKLIGLENK